MVKARIATNRQRKKPAAVSGAGFVISSDDATLPVICPTCQILSKMQQTNSGKLKTLVQNSAQA
jgi:hypothetical protein